MFKKFMFNLLGIEAIIPKGRAYIRFYEPSGYISMSKPVKMYGVISGNITLESTDETFIITQK